MKKNKQPLQNLNASQAPLFTFNVWRGIGTGVILSASGFAVLTQSDTAAQNWASYWAPALIAAGYALIAISLWKNGK